MAGIAPVELSRKGYGDLSFGAGSLRITPAETTDGHRMSRKDQIIAYGIVVAAFVFIVGIVAAPLMPRVWQPVTTATVKKPSSTQRPAEPSIVPPIRRG